MKTVKMSINVPDWVKYIAQDANGEVWGYEFKPVKENTMWGIEDIKQKLVTLYRGKPPEDFTKTLVEL